MKWIKRGVLFDADGDPAWMVSHAALPFADRIRAHQYRIYLASRNHRNLSQTAYVDVNLTDPTRILRRSKRPVLELGPLGAFDDSGVFPSWLVDWKGKKYLYYIGWNQGRRVRWYSHLGLAISSDGGRSFQKVSQGPLLDRNDVDPFLIVSCCVLIEDGLWRMWYTSGTGWDVVGDEDKWPPDVAPRYLIKYAESEDGLHWKRDGTVCLDFQSEEETAIARPCVRKEDEIYRMWYCYRGETYRIGYAESHDGIRWRREDRKAGIGVSDSGWDSEMIAYPYVFKDGQTYYMLYNGNRFGGTGFGYATLQAPIEGDSR